MDGKWLTRASPGIGPYVRLPGAWLRSARSDCRCARDRRGADREASGRIRHARQRFCTRSLNPARSYAPAAIKAIASFLACLIAGSDIGSNQSTTLVVKTKRLSPSPHHGFQRSPRRSKGSKRLILSTSTLRPRACGLPAAKSFDLACRSRLDRCRFDSWWSWRLRLAARR